MTGNSFIHICSTDNSFSHLDFVDSTRKCIVVNAIKYFYSDHYYYFLTLICPEIENGLRNLYARFNKYANFSFFSASLFSFRRSVFQYFIF
jgi:hypothetical protein